MSLLSKPAFSLAPLSLALLTSLAGPAFAASGPINWVEDDWAAAKTRAQKEKKLVAVDVWATWCHTCLSMKNYVLTEKPFTRIAKDHVWLSLDYDKVQNSAFFEKFPINVFPTFLVVDPKKGEVVARWAGSGTAEQMVKFFAEAKPDRGDALSRGQRALAVQDYETAAKILEPAIAKTKDKNHKTRLLAAYIESLWKLDKKQCAEKGLLHIDETNNTAPGIDFVSFVAYCSSAVEDKAKKKHIMTRVKARLERALAQKKKLPLSVDDMSALYDTLASAHTELGEAKPAKKVTQRHARMLEKAAKKAKTPEARATFDAYRLSCYLDLKRYKEAEKMLKASEKALPKDFNPAWRLAVLYQKQKKTALGLGAIERSLERGYGPRRARLYSTKIDLLMQKKDFGRALTTVKEAKSDLGKLDPKLVRKSWMDRLDAQEKEIAEKSAAKS